MRAAALQSEKSVQRDSKSNVKSRAMQPESRIVRDDLAGCGFVDGKGEKWNVRNVVQETRVSSAALAR